MRAFARMRVGAAVALLLAAALARPRNGIAMSVQGVTFPDTSTVGGKPVKLNGMGVRIAYVFVKVYVAGLYLTTPTHDGKAATDADEPKRMQLQFLREVSHDEMVDAMKEGFSHTGTPALQPQFDQFASWFKEPLREGSQVTFDYVPGTGTTGTIAGKNAGTIPGPEFMRALWGIWLGDDPPNQALKDGLLGKG